MKKSWKYILLNILTFGHLGRKVKAKLKANETKNNTLLADSTSLIDVKQVFSVFKKENIISVKASISSLVIEVKDKKNVDVTNIHKITKKGISINNNTYTIIVGQGAVTLAKEINHQLQLAQQDFTEK